MNPVCRSAFRRLLRLATRLAAPSLVCVAVGIAAAQDTPASGAAHGAAAAPKLDLNTCRQIALAQQPSLAAARTSLATAEARSQAVGNLPFYAPLISRDVPIRRKQSCLGVQIAQARVLQDEGDVIYSVTRTYYSAIYAQQQVKVADEALTYLDFLRGVTEGIVKAKSRPDVKERHVLRLDAYMHIAQGRQQEAVQGVTRAMAALREAMGVGPDYALQLADTGLPFPKVEVTRDQIVALALERRPELFQAAGFAEATCLEIKAQGASRRLKAATFAAASDIHSTMIAPPLFDGEYRPGGLPPEMPTMIPGKKNDRVEQARLLNDRANSVVDKTRNLIALDAEDTYLRFAEASKQIAEYAKAVDESGRVADELKRRFDPSDKEVGVDEVLNAGLLATQTKLYYNEAVFHYLITLAGLERATGGMFHVEFPAKTTNGQ
jgi:outer membrane protein TolC